MRGELDWIVMKALEKDRGRRYETASALARDIDRYLMNEAVAAEAAMRAFSDFLLHQVLAPARLKSAVQGVGVNLTIAQSVEEAEKKIEDEFKNKPIAEADVRHALGETWRNMRNFQAAEKQFRRALDLRRQHLGPDARQTLAAQRGLGTTLEEADRAKEAIPILEDALPRHRDALGNDNLDTLRCMDLLAMAYRSADRLADAVRLSEQALKQYEAVLGRDDLNALIAMRNLALAYTKAQCHDQAVALQKEIVALSTAKHGPNHPETVRGLSNLAMTYMEMNQFADAVPLLEKAVKGSKERLGPGDRETLIRLDKLGNAYSRIGAFDKAIPIFEELLASLKKAFPNNPFVMIETVQKLAASYAEVGKVRELEVLMKENLEQVMPLVRSGDDGAQLEELGFILLRKKQFGPAEGYLRECLKRREKSLPDDWRTFGARSLLGGALLSQKKYEEAARWRKELEATKAVQGKEKP